MDNSQIDVGNDMGKPSWGSWAEQPITSTAIQVNSDLFPFARNPSPTSSRRGLGQSDRATPRPAVAASREHVPIGAVRR